jgi:hypothetical protein
VTTSPPRRSVISLTVGAASDSVIVVVFAVDGNGSASELRMFVTAVLTAETTGALAEPMT